MTLKSHEEKTCDTEKVGTEIDKFYIGAQCWLSNMEWAEMYW